MDTSGEISHDDMSDYISEGPQYAASRRRSASFSEFSASPSANHGGSDQEVIVYSRAIIGPELDNCGPQDPIAREEFSQALAKTGYANKVAFPSMAVFMQSLAFVADPHDLEFLLDSKTFDFLVVAWIMDDGGRSYSKILQDTFHRKMVAQQRRLQQRGTAGARRIGAHNREI